MPVRGVCMEVGAGILICYGTPVRRQQLRQVHIEGGPPVRAVRAEGHHAQRRLRPALALLRIGAVR